MTGKLAVHFIATLIEAVAVILYGPNPSVAAGIVGTGMSSSCTEAALDTALGCGAPSGSPPLATCIRGGRISFDCGPDPVTITMTSTKAIAADTTIDGGALITISGGDTLQVFIVNSGVTLALANLTVSHASCGGECSNGGAIFNSGTGGAIFNAGTLNVTNCAFRDNSASGSDFAAGGAIYNVGTLTATASTFADNSIGNGYGGALCNTASGIANVTDSAFSGNKITGDGGLQGGAILNVGTLMVRSCTFFNNSARYGAAIFTGCRGCPFDGVLTVTDSVFSKNSAGGASGFGGAILSQSRVTVRNSTFDGNDAVTAGGAIYTWGYTTPAHATLTDSAFVSNSSTYGGAIDAENAVLAVSGSTFSKNTAQLGGGAIVNGNRASGGTYGGVLSVSNSTFFSNSVTILGDQAKGVIWNECGGTLTMSNSTVANNRDALANDGCGTATTVATLTNTIIADSTSGGNCSGSITDGGHNLDSDGTCGVGPATNPMLDPAGLADNGGPTQTIALEPNSPAINAGDETVCAAPPVNNLDQRDFVRPGTGAANCSIGAYEYNSPGTSDCCQCATSCAVPINGSCGGCILVVDATCDSGDLCVLHTPAPSPTPTPITPSPTPSPTATNTPGTNDCCQCASFCAAPIVGTCGGCAVVFGASCTGGSLCIPQTATPTPTETPTPAQPKPCAGDCNGDGAVTADEILTMVNIALGNADATACPNGIPSGAQVDVAVILTAVNNALNGCP